MITNSIFKLFLCSTPNKDRPPISFHIKEYFEQFVIENVFSRNQVVINGRWNIHLSIMFIGEGERFTLREVKLTKGHRTIKGDAIKLYEVLIPLVCIKESENPQLKTIELMYEGIKIFLTTTYKKIKPEFMDDLWSEVNINNLLSYPYPAPLIEQKYVGDIVNPDGSVKILDFF